MSKDEDVGITDYIEETLIGLISKSMFLVITYILLSDMKGILSFGQMEFELSTGSSIWRS